MITTHWFGKISAFWHHHHLRLIVYVLVILAIGASAVVLEQIQTERSILLAEQQLANAQLQNLLAVSKDLRDLTTKITTYKNDGIDTTTIMAQIPVIETALFHDKNLGLAKMLIATANTQLEQLRTEKLAADQAAKDAIANQSTLTGKITDGTTPLGGVSVSLLTGTTVISKSTADSGGAYSLTAPAGSYTLTASRSGYATYHKYNVVLTAKQTTAVDIGLVKAVSTSSSGSSSTAHSSYERKTITTSNGSFLVDIITLDLGSGAIRVVTDTGNDTDCADNCSANPVSSYVGANGGFAGINGTYFCPPDYASCAGQTNTFFWKVRNTRLGKTINQSNGLGENEPYLTFSASGQPTYYSSWKNAPVGVYAGINSGPRLVENGVNVLTDASMDDKQRTVKSNRGALGVKGKTLYAIVAKGATVPDMATILVSLGVDNALNLDGGGSSALYYNGSYKTGPGRALPNAIIFAGG